MRMKLPLSRPLADGAITQEQADQMLENMPTFAPGQGGRGGHRGGPRGGGPRGGGAQGGFGQGSSFGNQSAPLDGQDA